MSNSRGAIVLGYPQYEFWGFGNKGGRLDFKIKYSAPTPWNQIEATLAFQHGIPVLVVAHTGIRGGVFDHGVTGQYVLTKNLRLQNWFMEDDFQGMFKDWMSQL